MCTQQGIQDHLTVKRFRELMPRFADYPRDQIEAWIERAKCMFNTCVWGCQLEWGEANWIAHKLSIFGDGTTPPLGGASSFASSKRVGDTSVSYSDAMLTLIAKGGGYALTPYGQEYLSLVDSLPQGMGLMIV